MEGRWDGPSLARQRRSLQKIYRWHAREVLSVATTAVHADSTSRLTASLRGVARYSILAAQSGICILVLSAPAASDRGTWDLDARSRPGTGQGARAGYQGTLHQLPALYRQVACPTLVLWAEQDKHFPLVQANRLHETLPSSRLVVLHGGTHWMALQRPGELAESILDRRGA